MLNMSEQNFGELGGQVVDSQQPLGHGRIDGMGAEVELLLFNGLFDWYAINDVLLGPVFNSNESEA